jgi:hypothetical protein
LHVCPLQYSSCTLPATQFKPGLLADKLSEVQMSYFYLCLSVCQYLWIIKFLEWAYRKKRGDMRRYFHRFGYWGFIFRLNLLRFSFVFFINLPIRKSTGWSWVSDSGHYLTTGFSRLVTYLWIIKFLEWAYRKKGGIWGGIFIDWDIEGSFSVWFYYVFRLFHIPDLVQAFPKKMVG